MKMLEKAMIGSLMAGLLLLGYLVLNISLTNSGAENDIMSNLLEKESEKHNRARITEGEEGKNLPTEAALSRNENAKEKESHRNSKETEGPSAFSDTLQELSLKIEALRSTIAENEYKSLLDRLGIDCMGAVKDIDSFIFRTTLEALPDKFVFEEDSEMIKECLDVIKKDKDTVLSALLALIVGQSENTETKNLVVDGFMEILREKPEGELEFALVCGLTAYSGGSILGYGGKWDARMGEIRKVLRSSRSTFSCEKVLEFDSNHPNPHLRAAKSDKVRDALVEVTGGDYSTKARLFAIESLWERNQEEKVSTALKDTIRYDSCEEIREAAVKVLAGEWNIEVIPDLEHVSQTDPSEEVRKAAKSAVEKLKAAKSAIEKVKSKSEK